MGGIAAELLKIFILTLCTGFFAGSEMALISLRKTRVQELIKAGNKQAKVVHSLQEDPEKFIATAQIGISVITIIASILAGADMARLIEPILDASHLEFITSHAETISNIITISLIGFITIIFGELVPKSLAIHHSEKFALIVAYPLFWISRLCSLLIHFLTFCSNIILLPFKDSASFSESKLSEEEIRNMIWEGHKAGTIEGHEHQILENVFDFSDTNAGKIMTTTAQITAFDIDDSTESIINKVIESEYSRIPFYSENKNNIIGILNIKDLYSELRRNKMESKGINLRDLLNPVFFVPTTQKIMTVLRKFQKTKIHLAIVTDEHGEVAGLLTLEDILEEIVGDISDETDEARRQIHKQEDGTYLIDGDTSIIDLNRHFKTALPESENFSTISGFILNSLERFPELEEQVEFENLVFNVVQKTPRTIKLVKLTIKEKKVKEE